MRGTTIARRYAKALLELAEERGETEKVERDLEALVEAWTASKELREVFENPAVTAEARVAVLGALARRLGLSPVLLNTLRLLCDRHRLRLIPEVAQAFAALREERGGLVVAEVTTAGPMPESYFAELAKTLEKALGRKVTVTKREDPALIGGVVTRVGDRIYDGSLRTRLQELKDRMLTH